MRTSLSSKVGNEITDGNEVVILLCGFYVKFDEIMKKLVGLSGELWSLATQQYLPNNTTF